MEIGNARVSPWWRDLPERTTARPVTIPGRAVVMITGCAWNAPPSHRDLRRLLLDLLHVLLEEVLLDVVHVDLATLDV